MLHLVALSTIGVASAATANVATLCDALTTGVCGAYQFKGLGSTSANCQSLFNNILGMTGANLTLGDDADVGMNTVGCRQRWAAMANAMDNSTCRYAGLTGGGMCGNVVTAACDHITTNCGSNPNTADQSTYPFGTNATACRANLAGIAGQWGSKQGSDASDEDSIECRVYHAIAGWNGGAWGNIHCNHTMSPSGYAGVCSGKISVNARHHCDTTLSYCSGAGVAQYNTLPECLSTFALFPNAADDARAANSANDQGCRQYHTQAAAAGAGDVHCTHGGPSGQYVCGGSAGTRDVWRWVAKNPACAAANLSLWSNAIEAAFTTWARADIEAVMPTLGNSSVPGTNYHTGFTGDNDFCRIYHCTVASTGGATNLTHCEHCAITSSQCFETGVAPGIGAICRMIQTGCGTSSFADQATCVTKLTAIASSKPGDSMTLTPPATDTLACRAYYAGVALATKNTAGAAAASAGPCVNTKEAAGAGCGGATTPAKSDAATLFVSAAIVLPFLM